ncbi:MAG: polyprenol phosphomannose-dependent alpha 1,6 mannosyltransferase MptB, partial [Marmoricola sp.]|nr:polyprenol phosphomannose-dependent alpha 1,6 mannosyltransferase MptB [Marmoricola sp.]
MRWILLRGVVGSCLIVLAGLIYARVPLGGVRHFPLRAHGHHLTTGICIAFAGLVLLTWAWLGLVRRVSGQPDGVRLSRWTALAWTAPLVLAPPLFSNDGWSYVAVGYLAGHGSSPYTTPPTVLSPALLSGVDPLWRDTTSPYGPLPILWGAIFSRVTADPWTLMVANRLLAYVGLALLAVAVPVLARRTGRDPGRATALAVASPLVVVHGIGGLHNDLILGALVTGALAVTTRNRWWWGAVLAGLALAVKLPGAGIAIGVVLLSLVPGATMFERVRRGIAVGLVA